MKKVFLILSVVFALFLMVACGNTTQENQKAQEEVTQMDSISKEMDRVKENIEQTADEIEKAVDNMLEELE